MKMCVCVFEMFQCQAVSVCKESFQATVRCRWRITIDPNVPVGTSTCCRMSGCDVWMCSTVGLRPTGHIPAKAIRNTHKGNTLTFTTSL